MAISEAEMERRLRERGLLPRSSLGGARLKQLPGNRFAAYVIDADGGAGREAELTREEAGALQALSPDARVLGDDEPLVGPEQEEMLASLARKPMPATPAAARSPLVDLSGFAAPRKGAPALPPGRTPFFLGDKAEHQVQARKPTAGLEDALSWAAGMGRVPPHPESGLEVGQPVVISRTPKAPQPGLSARSAAKTSAGDLQRVAQSAQPRRAPSSLQSVFDVDPDVGAYMASQLDEELAGAQSQSRDNLLAARLTRAGAMGNRAISGARYDGGALDDLEAGARQPVADLQERRKAQSELDERGMRRAAFERAGATDARDYNFRVSQAERQEALDRDRLAQQERLRTDDREARLEEARIRRSEMNLRKRELEDAKAAAAGQKRQDMLDRQDEKDLQELGKRSQDAAMMREDLEILNRHLGKSDIPGVGPVVSALPEFFLTSDGTELRQAATRLYRLKVKLESGMTVTPQEAATALEARGMGPGRSETAFRKGMESLRNESVAALRNIEANFNPRVVEARRTNGGTTSRDMPAAVPMRTGRYKRDAQGRLWAEMSDGSAQEVR